MKIPELVTPDDCYNRLLQDLSDPTKRIIPSGFKLLDRKLGGGFKRGMLYTLCSRPGIGKTSFAIKLAEGIKEDILFVGIGMPYSEFNVKHRPGKRFTIYCKPVNHLSVDDIQSVANGVTEYADHELGAIFIDYLQLIRSVGNFCADYTSGIVADLKRMAVELNVPVICLCQLPPSVENRNGKRPVISDVPYGVEIYSNYVLLMHREDFCSDAMEEPSKVELSIMDKETGSLGEVIFNASFGELKSEAIFREVEAHD